jgi:hypothetical protein
MSTLHTNASPPYRDKKHVDWARSYISLIDELAKYVTEYHKTGLSWNPKVGILYCPIRTPEAH